MLSIVTGCASLNKVQQSLDETNQALLNSTVALNQAALPGEILPDSTGQGVTEPWEEPSARIDAFIAAHPNDKPTASALRVRQAMLLLAYKQYNLAAAAFDQATELHLSRDKALKALKDELIWWFKVDQTVAPGAEVDEKIAAFSKQIAALNGDPKNESIRDYLAEMRAWIQLYAASHAVNDTMMANIIANAMDNYAETLTDDDIAAINTGKTTPGLGPFEMQARRQIRAKTVIDRAAKIVKDLEEAGDPVPYVSEKAKKITAINR
ncbi:MAG: hypothetical protein GY850_27990 [bacterium]|nr:hypothetical protein [bacterium]